MVSWRAEVLRTWRSLVRRPAFFVLASVTLGLGITAFVAAFTLFDALVLRPLPFSAGRDIAVYGWRAPDAAWRVASPMLYAIVGTPDTIRSRGFARMPGPVNVDIGNRPQLLQAQRVDSGFLDTLGIAMQAGRAAMRIDEVIVSDALWKTAYHGDAGAVGRVIQIDGRPVRIAGILPADYRFLADVDVLMPLDPVRAAGDNATNMVAIARMADHAGVEAFSTLIRETVGRNAAALGVDGAYLDGYGATSLDDMMKAQGRPSIVLFLVCALLVLLVAGVNLFNLVLIRGAARAHDSAIRVVLGAPAWRVSMPAVAESLAIGTVAAAVGIVAGTFLVQVLWLLVPNEWRIASVAPSPGWRVGVTVLALSLAVALATVLGNVGHVLAGASLRERFAIGARIRSGAIVRRTGTSMVFLQAGLATMLLTFCASLIVQLWHLHGVPLGFDPTGAMLVDIRPDHRQYASLADVSTTLDAIRGRVASIHGVESAGVSTHLPVGRGFLMPFRTPDGDSRSFQYGLVTPGALTAMGLTFVAGRDVADTDAAGAAHVAVVNQAYVDEIGRAGIGGTLRTASRLSPAEDLRIVGVVASTRQAGPANEAVPTVYLPFAQAPEGSFAYIRHYLPFYVVARGASGIAPDVASIERAIGRVAPHLAVANPRLLAGEKARATSAQRRDALIAATFAAMAVALACIGVYSAQSVMVASRRRELALRAALGAFPGDLYGLVLAHGLRTALAGVSVGLLAALFIRYRVSTSIVDTAPLGPALLAGVTVAMLVTMALAVTGPAMRAAAVDPVKALRGDR